MERGLIIFDFPGGGSKVPPNYHGDAHVVEMLHLMKPNAVLSNIAPFYLFWLIKKTALAYPRKAKEENSKLSLAFFTPFDVFQY